MMKRSLLLLTLMPLYLSADGPEIKEIVDSVTYQEGSSLLKANFTIEKKENPNSVTYSEILNDQEVKILGYTLKVGTFCARYIKNKQTKEIRGSASYVAPFMREYIYFNKAIEGEEAKHYFKKLKTTLYILKKNEASAKKNN